MPPTFLFLKDEQDRGQYINPDSVVSARWETLASGQEAFAAYMVDSRVVHLRGDNAAALERALRSRSMQPSLRARGPVGSASKSLSEWWDENKSGSAPTRPDPGQEDQG